MARTTTAKAHKEGQATKKSKKGTLIPQGWNVQRGGSRNTLASQNRDAMSEKSFQMLVERYQLANLKGNYSMDTVVAKADRELKRLQDMEKNISFYSKEKIKPVSTWGKLAELYKRDLAHQTLELYQSEAQGDIKRAMAKSRGVVTAEQEKEIITYFVGRAQFNFSKVENIYKILVMKGAIKDNTAAKEIDKKLDELTKEKEQQNAPQGEQLVPNPQA